MKRIEKIKFICGLILVSFAILGGLIFYFESFGFFKKVLDEYRYSDIWTSGNEGASNASIFLGLCGLAGAYLLASIRPVISEEKGN